MAKTRDDKTNDDRMLFAQLAHVLGRFHDLHPDMTVQQVRAFLWLAANEGATQREAAPSLGFTESSTSRVLSLLSEFGSRKVAGLDLIRSEINPNDRRERNIYLTTKGKRLAEDIKRDLKI